MVRQTGPASRIFSQPILIGGFELLDLVQAGKGGAAHLGREGQAQGLGHRASATEMGELIECCSFSSPR